MKQHRYQFSAVRDTPLGDDWVLLTGDDFRSSERRTREIVEMAKCAPDWADDLWQIARAVYLVDRRVLRDEPVDGWTRSLELSVQVTNTNRWSVHTLGRLNGVLRVLTGDHWFIRVRRGATPIDKQTRLMSAWQADEVSLFSGGMDSTAHVAGRISAGVGHLLLIGNDVARAGRAQDRMHAVLTRECRPGTVQLRQFAWQPKGAADLRLEPSTRSRGLLFVATGVLAAAAHGLAEVAMPENGQLAINPPLTPARIAACSTRSVHPWILHEFNKVIRDIGGDVAVQNPLFGLTKGEVCQQARRAGVEPHDLAQAVSCGNHPANRAAVSHCGYCYPCLIRRSGMIHALGRDPTTYEYEPGQLKTPKQLQHLQDLRQWLARDFTTRNLIADTPLPPEVPFGEALAVIMRGRAELRHMLAHYDLDRFETTIPTNAPSAARV